MMVSFRTGNGSTVRIGETFKESAHGLLLTVGERIAPTRKTYRRPARHVRMDIA